MSNAGRSAKGETDYAQREGNEKRQNPDLWQVTDGLAMSILLSAEDWRLVNSVIHEHYHGEDQKRRPLELIARVLTKETKTMKLEILAARHTKDQLNKGVEMLQEFQLQVGNGDFDQSDDLKRKLNQIWEEAYPHFFDANQWLQSLSEMRDQDN